MYMPDLEIFQQAFGFTRNYRNSEGKPLHRLLCFHPPPPSPHVKSKFSFFLLQRAMLWNETFMPPRMMGFAEHDHRLAYSYPPIYLAY